MHKSGWKLWLCLLGACVDFFLIGWLTGFDGWFPYMHVFNALSVLVWYAMFYLHWQRRLSRRACVIGLTLTVLTALPHILGALLTYGSWVCLGVSVVLAVFLIVWLVQMHATR